MSYIGNEPIVSATRTVTEVTATAGQTVFNANGGYTVGYLDVFLNGAQLQTVDFTATNGSSVTLTEAAQVNDVVRLVAWGTFQSANLSGAGLLDGTVAQAKLATGVAGTGPAFSAYMSANQSISANTVTKVAFDLELFDTNSNFNTANNRFTPTVAGYYQMTFAVYVVESSRGIYTLNFYKNGVLYKQSNYNVSPTSPLMSNVTTLVYLNGTTDYMEAYFSSQLASTLGGLAGSQYFEFSGCLVRAA
jgi:hypothetical protein